MFRPDDDLPAWVFCFESERPEHPNLDHDGVPMLLLVAPRPIESDPPWLASFGIPNKPYDSGELVSCSDGSCVVDGPSLFGEIPAAFAHAAA